MVPLVSVWGFVSTVSRLSMVEWKLTTTFVLYEKIRQVPGGEYLPSHQKSHQALGGVRLLAGLPFAPV
jgi:hypothetical protein